ncbi:MAG: hypothetical protein HGB00_00950 [Chlorobiaceae bacterium]|nr:hypothetical protein [Chlorobiaceae bacterium]
MRKTPTLFTLCSLLYASPTYASFGQNPVEPKGLAMAGAMTAVHGDAFGMFYNPASTALAEGTMAGISYTLPYGDNDLVRITGGFCLPLMSFDRHGTLSGGVSRFGTNGYDEQTAAFGYARHVTSSLRAGISVSRMSIRMRGVGDESATGVNAGVQAELKPGLTIGISSMNLNSPAMGASGTPLHATTLTGVSYRLATGTLLTVNAMTSQDRSGRFLAAGEFPVSGNIELMIGMATNPSVVSAGTGIRTGAFRATLAVSRNMELGTTSSCGVDMTL